MEYTKKILGNQHKAGAGIRVDPAFMLTMVKSPDA